MSESTTHLLTNARAGDRAAIDALLPRIYDELRVLAKARLRRHGPGETLNTTALVHEAYLKLTAGETPGWQDRSHFFALAGQAMRYVLVGYARRRSAVKRGGGKASATLNEAIAVTPSNAVEEEALNLIQLDDALTALAERNERLARLVEFRFFAGMTYEEIAAATEMSVPTVKRDWTRARTWLYSLMQESGDKHDTP